MLISFKQVPIFSPHRVETIPDGEFETLGRCPVCDAAVSPPIVRVSGVGESRANEVSFCAACEHTFLSRRPRASWYAAYYRDDWDRGKTKGRRGALGRLRRTIQRRRIGRYDFRRAGGNVSALKILPMLNGVASGDSYGLIPDPSIRSVLEIGCGYGFALDVFQRLGLRAVGIEASRTRAEACRSIGLDVHLCNLDEVAAIGAGPFDLIYSSHVFEHVLAPTKYLANLRDLVRDGGYVYIEVPGVEEAEGLIKFAHSVMHVHGYSAASLSRMMELAGFRVVRIRSGVNLHVLAIKEPGTGHRISGFASDESLTRGLCRLETAGRRDVCISFDSLNLEIIAEGNGELLYKSAVHFSRSPSQPTVISATIDPAEDGIVLRSPVEAPIWVKRQ